MQDQLDELKTLCEQKAARPQDRDTIVRRQLEILSGLKDSENVTRHVVQKILERIRNVENHKEFNISLEEYNTLVKKKNVKDHLSRLFMEDILEINTRLDDLQSIVQGSNAADELSKIKEIEEILVRIDNETGPINDYLKVITSLHYDKRYIAGARIVAKIAKGILFRIRVEGIENIPKNGKCILAPHHVNSAFDPVILNAIIPRKLFYLGAVEAFTTSLSNWLYTRLGVMPFKRIDKSFGTPKKGLKSEAELHAYPFSNRQSIMNILKYLWLGEAVVIFPEGDTKIWGRYVRPNNEEFIKLQPGLVALALQAADVDKTPTPVIPIGISYSPGLLNTGTFSSVTVRIGQPMFMGPAENRLTTNKDKIIEEYNIVLLDKIKQLSA